MAEKLEVCVCEKFDVMEKLEVESKRALGCMNMMRGKEEIGNGVRGHDGKYRAA